MVPWVPAHSRLKDGVASLAYGAGTQDFNATIAADAVRFSTTSSDIFHDDMSRVGGQ
jgi:hypothetical protein